jgi:hypothetical protein
MRFMDCIRELSVQYMRLFLIPFVFCSHISDECHLYELIRFRNGITNPSLRKGGSFQ